MYKGVFIDIDGTLIKSDHTVSPATISTIKKIKDQHILVALVSARPLHGIRPISDAVGLADLPLASLNGSYIAFKGDILFESYIDSAIVARLHEQLQPYNATIIYYEHQQWYAEERNHHIVKEQKITPVPVTIQPFETTLAHWQQIGRGPNKILVIQEAAVIAKIEDDLKPLHDAELNMYTSKPIYLEMMNKSASKTNAIRFLIDRYHIKQEETIAIGDNFNDKEMIEFAGKGIAMGNAPDAVKAVADYVTDTNNNDGVALALTKFMNL